MAHRFSAKVIFMQVVEFQAVATSSYDAVMLNAPLLEQRTKDASTYLTALRGEFRQKGITAKRLVEQGAVVRTIIEVAAREEADLIAMASHGRGGLSRVFYGSVAAGVLQQVDRLLLLVRSQGHE
ncbi:MAG: universal stress protein [Chloroflexi bacterium]|nr:universal stress protein [Chloroflexota bacterium]